MVIQKIFNGKTYNKIGDFGCRRSNPEKSNLKQRGYRSSCEICRKNKPALNDWCSEVTLLRIMYYTSWKSCKKWFHIFWKVLRRNTTLFWKLQIHGAPVALYSIINLVSQLFWGWEWIVRDFLNLHDIYKKGTDIWIFVSSELLYHVSKQGGAKKCSAFSKQLRRRALAQQRSWNKVWSIGFD